MGGDLFDVFFSYHWRDHAQVEAVARTLTERGLRVFLDRWYLAPGQPWPQALERTLASCSSVAVFLGADGLGPWQQRERDLALDRQGREPGFPVIPVLLTRADPALGFLKLNTWIDLSANVADEAALETLRAAICRQPPGSAGLTQIAAVRAQICPYRGLRPFREEDAAFFCGREAFTDKLVEAVERSSLVAVVGASGIGKSSVVRAGLIPRLREAKAGRVWEITTLVPTDRPLHGLAAALVPILEPEMTRVDRLAEINKLAEHLAEGSVALRDVAADVLRTQPGTDRLLLFVDQWEELYTLTADDGARRRFLAEILDASEKGPVTVVVTLRGDFFGQALSDRSFADRLQGAQVNLGPMTQEELERSIIEPAEKAGLKFEPGLVDRILDDVGDEPGSLPLLEFVLAALWEQRRGITLHHDAYERMGGVQGAIAARADAEFEKLSAAQKDAARHMLIQMVRPGEETEDTRQRAVLPVGNETALTVIRRLADARLVVTARDAASGAETAEVTHEALIRHWTLLRTWVDQDREFLRSKARLEAAAVLWEGDKRDPSRLLPTGHPLAEGKRILASRRLDLGGSVVAFIEASAAADARMRGRRLWSRVAALAAGLLVLAGGVVYWDFYVRDHEQHYNAYAKRWGVFEGVGAVHPDDVEHRSRTFRFVRQGRLGPVVRMDAVDGSGNCAARGMPDVIGMDLPEGWDSPLRLCRIVWERPSKDRVSRQTMHATNRVIFSLVSMDAKGLIADFRAETGHFAQMGSVGAVATTITYERIEDGPHRGQEQAERYTDTSGEPKRFIGGAYGQRLERSPDGLIVSYVLLGRDDKPMQTKAGFAEVRIRRDETALPVEFSLFDENGRPTPGWRGVSRWTLTYDARGNQVREDYFDETGRPTLNKDGYATMTLAYGAGGKEIERGYLDEAGRPALNKKGYARITMERDLHGRLIKEAYFDQANKPTLSSDGYAAAVRTYDQFGNLVEKSYFDREGRPTQSKDGYAKIKAAHGDHRLASEVTYFDAAGMPTLSKDGYAKQTLIHDRRGNVREESYFDERGMPRSSKGGYARVVKDYDGVGQLVGEAYFDEAANPTLSNERYAKVVTTYDGQGNKVKVAYFDSAGKATLSKSGYASIEFAHDPPGRIVGRSYYDKNRNLVPSKDGYAHWRSKFDERGNQIETAYFDVDGKPVVSKDGYAGWRSKFDERGNEIETAYFGVDGKPIMSTGGYAGWRSKFDERGNQIETAYFGVAGKPIVSKGGYAGWRSKFDERGNQIESAYFGVDGKPIVSKDGYAGWRSKFDERGNQIESTNFGVDGKPVVNTGGYAGWRSTFDGRGNQIETAYLGVDDKPMVGKDGYGGWRSTFDERGNQIESRVFRFRRQADREHGRVCRLEVDVRWTWQPDRDRLFRCRRQADREHGRVCRLEVDVRRARQPDRVHLFWCRRQADHERERVCRLEVEVRRTWQPDRDRLFWCRRQAGREQGWVCHQEAEGRQSWQRDRDRLFWCRRQADNKQRRICTYRQRS